MTEAATVRKRAAGFGYLPEDSTTYYRVTLHGPGQPAVVTEHSGVDDETGALRITIAAIVWERIAVPVAATLNVRLTKLGYRTGRWKARGSTPLERLAGKELMVLAWAVEHVTGPELLGDVERVIVNWQGFAPEERWWLYTSTAAASVGPEWKGVGWRAALRHIMVENPVSAAHHPELAPARRLRGRCGAD